MKTTINLLAGQCKNILQLLSGKYNEAPVQYNFQPLPSYWAMSPDSRAVIMHTKRN
ncbi:hypothetical protein [Ferruginibacter sp. SUN106]|uniref:hypothetical protein n=1 Tax=Ferruginibacter sp. SUN106 TaxID=2978348 RepID=UPI003D36529D